MVRIFPSLRQHAIVPVDVVRIETELSLLGVLLDGVVHLIGGQLHLGGRLLGDFAHKVEVAFTGVERDVVPCRDDGAFGVLEDTEFQRFGGTL